MLLKGSWHAWPGFQVVVESIFAVSFKSFREGQNEICLVWQRTLSALPSAWGRGEVHVFLSPLGCRIPCLYLACRLRPSARVPLAVPGYIQPLGMCVGILTRVVATPPSTCYEDLRMGWGEGLGQQLRLVDRVNPWSPEHLLFC